MMAPQPQESRRGVFQAQILFLAYINAITEIPLSDESDLIIFADDMALVHPITDEDAVLKIQEDVNKINKGIEDLGLCLNANK